MQSCITVYYIKRFQWQTTGAAVNKTTNVFGDGAFTQGHLVWMPRDIRERSNQSVVMTPRGGPTSEIMQRNAQISALSWYITWAITALGVRYKLSPWNMESYWNQKKVNWKLCQGLEFSNIHLFPNRAWSRFSLFFLNNNLCLCINRIEIVFLEERIGLIIEY